MQLSLHFPSCHHPQAPTPSFATSRAATMSESATHFALATTDIVEEIVEHLAPGKECTSRDQRQSVSALTRVSKVFHSPATKALWARLSSLQPLLLLLPEQTLYPARRRRGPGYVNITPAVSRLSVTTIDIETWLRFCNRIAMVRHLSLHLSDFHHIPEESWSYLARFLDATGLFFPYLQTLSSGEPTVSGDDLQLLTSLSLRSVPVRYYAYTDGGQKKGYLLAVQQMLNNAPRLTDLTVVCFPGDFFTHIRPMVLRKLRTLSIEIELEKWGREWAQHKWLPTTDALQVLSTLNALESLQVVLDVDCDSNVEFVGFRSLTTLTIYDCRPYNTMWLLAKCSSPCLHTLTIDLLKWYEERFGWHELQPLCSTIAETAPQLHTLHIDIGYIPNCPEQSQDPDMLLPAVRPLLALCHLKHVSLSFNANNIMPSDAVLESFAKAWPALVSLKILYGYYLNRSLAPEGSDKVNATLRSLRAFATYCPNLRTLHIPRLYVTAEDCTDDRAHWDDTEHVQGHQLQDLQIRRVFTAFIDITDERWVADAWILPVHNIFPHIDVKVAPYAAVFLRFHSGRNPDARAHRCIWVGALNILE
ncbi:hypothetical protein C2E23DRAFT_625704 [Lenzites betulinus]|nr:hypothetical protein C2E23DRAFT_625704 [Lenzites betulinus]